MSKIYAVRKGRKKGLFFSWKDCEEVVKKFPGAEYKSFYYEKDALDYLNKDTTSPLSDSETCCNENELAAFVDGSFNKDTGKYGFGGVLVDRDGCIVCEFKGCDCNPQFVSSRNVAGELQGAMRAVTLCCQLGKSLVIYHDYIGISQWADGSWKAESDVAKDYVDFLSQTKLNYPSFTVRFVKVTAHSGVSLNERADFLAKSAVEIKN